MDWEDDVTDAEMNEMADIIEAMEATDDEMDVENQTGGHLFDFRLTPTAPRQRWRNVVDRRVFDATLSLNREPERRNDLGRELTSALHRAVTDQIRDNPSVEPHHRLHFVLQTTTDTF